MKEQSAMGMNRTGVQMSPLNTKDMQAVLPDVMPPALPAEETALAEMRSRYIAEADPIGSVPLPGSFKGAVSAGASLLTGNQPQVLLDKLGERLAFERSGVRLYDALITKFNALQEAPPGMTLAELQAIRQDEANHFSLIASAIESIGGDPTAQTPCADVAGVEASGLMKVVTDPRTTIAQSLDAILVAELADNASWEMLIALAEANGQEKMISGFTTALEDERVHLHLVRKWCEEAVIGTAVSKSPMRDEPGDAGAPPQVH